MTSAVVLAALVGAGAALAGQLLAQILTAYRETRARLRKEKRVSKVFTARIKASAFYFSLFADRLTSPVDATFSDVKESIRFATETFDALALDFANTKLLLSLEPNAIERIGAGIAYIRTLLRIADNQAASFEKTGWIDDERKATIVGSLTHALSTVDEMLAALGEPPVTVASSEA
jgi:hypothetical protein